VFPYLFAIFCFGLAITGIASLGLLRAAEQAKHELELEDQRAERRSEGSEQNAVDT
jgi:hypothetical protein